MKKENFIFGVILGIAVIVMFVTNNRISVLEKQLKGEKTIQEENEEAMKTEVVLQGKYSELVQAMFPFNGEYYVEASNNITFYSDIECTKEITGSPRFLSRNIENISIGNIRIYSYLLENGEICYSPADKFPNLVREEDYNWYIKEE